MNYNLTIGINLDDRSLITDIPDDTEVSEFKYIAKVDENNFIAEDFIEVEGYVGKCSIGYINYLKDNQPCKGIFYLKSNSNIDVNSESITFPEKFGVITEIDDTAVLYPYIKRKKKKKVYVMGEDLSKKESLDKNEIKTEIEEQVRSSAVPTNSVMGFDGEASEIPGGFELTDQKFGGGGVDVFICREDQTIDDAPEEAKIIIDSNIVNAKPNEVVNSMTGNETDKAPSVNAVKDYIGIREERFVLWQNSNPTSTIAVNNITNFTNQQDYDEIEVIFKRTNTQNYIYTTGRVPKGYNVSLDCQATSSDTYGWIRSRNLERINDYSYKHVYPSIQFTNENKSTAEAGACIPIIIYGYKRKEVE